MVFYLWCVRKCEFRKKIITEWRDLNLWLSFYIKDTKISDLGYFSHFSVKSRSSFPPILNWLFFEKNFRVIINKLLDLWETMIKIKHINLCYESRADEGNIINPISQRVYDWKRKFKWILLSFRLIFAVMFQEFELYINFWFEIQIKVSENLLIFFELIINGPELISLNILNFYAFIGVRLVLVVELYDSQC